MNLALRVVSGAVLLAVIAGALWVGLPAVATVVGIAAVVAAWEYRDLAGRVIPKPAAWLLYPLTLWLALRFAFPAEFTRLDWPLIAAVAGGLVIAVLARGSFPSWAAGVSGGLYLGLSLGYFIALFRWHPVDVDHFGLRLVALALLGAMVGDTVAYFVGTAAGRHRFFPSISPRKSIEGAVAGGAATVLLAAFAGPALIGISVPLGAGLGALIAVAAQGGDLAESALKREAGVKDSSSLIPGHGGLLDRVDSLVLVGPVVYCYLKLISLA